MFPGEWGEAYRGMVPLLLLQMAPRSLCGEDIFAAEWTRTGVEALISLGKFWLMAEGDNGWGGRGRRALLR